MKKKEKPNTGNEIWVNSPQQGTVNPIKVRHLSNLKVHLPPTKYEKSDIEFRNKRHKYNEEINEITNHLNWRTYSNIPFSGNGINA